MENRKLTPKQKERILERDAYICAYCMGEATEVDHVIPWNYRHDNDESNLVAACRDCNAFATDKVFRNFEEKLKYIRKHRGIDFFKKKKDQSYCTDCGRLFRPRFSGSTKFQCPECEEKAEAGEGFFLHNEDGRHEIASRKNNRGAIIMDAVSHGKYQSQN